MRRSSKNTSEDTVRFAQNAMAQKTERVARSALSDLIVFYEALEHEMERLRECERQGLPVDQALYHYMEQVDKSYRVAMDGFAEFDADRERNALITFADAVQDMITYIHKRREQ